MATAVPFSFEGDGMNFTFYKASTVYTSGMINVLNVKMEF
jgi:hypothetical protein